MRNVIVTGATRGLGLAIASRLVIGGFNVIGVARSDSPAFRAATTARGSSGEPPRGALRLMACDLSALNALAGFVAEVRREVGPIYGLVNNAGMGASALLSMMTDAEIERVVRLNTLSPILLTKYVVRSMMIERCGRIVNISSVVAATGFKGLSVYAATKSSLLGFTRSLAREVGTLGITVNAVAPGFAATDMTQEMNEEQRSKIARRSALRRLVEPADVAGAVAYLLGEEASGVTGATLTVDAGSTA